MADVFISYKREERQAVERLAQELRKLGLDVWFDASLNAGEAFSDEIDREAHAAKAILVCWSPTARESQWVKSEALIGFEQRKLAACYVAGPDGFYPPTPFNSIHAEDLRAWVGTPSNTHAGYKSILRRIGALSGRADIESYGALDVQAPPSTLRDWIELHQSSPLFMAVDELLHVRDVEEAERARLEQEARERRAREEAERRAKDEAGRRSALAETPRQSPPAPHEASSGKRSPLITLARDLFSLLMIVILMLAFGPITLLLMRKWLSLSVWAVSIVGYWLSGVSASPDSFSLDVSLLALISYLGANFISLLFLLTATLFTRRR